MRKYLSSIILIIVGSLLAIAGVYLLIADAENADAQIATPDHLEFVVPNPEPRPAPVPVERPTTTTTVAPTTTTVYVPPTTTPTSPPTTTPTTTAPESNGSCAINPEICHRESRGDYTAVNPTSGAGGKYQFMQSTWNHVARNVNPAYVGVHPASAPPAIQDQFARWLYNQPGGCAHWSDC